MIRMNLLDGMDKITRAQIKPHSRDEHLVRIERWNEAQRKLEEICKEKGIPVPIMVC